jgi:hypothetical protein
MHPSLKEGVSDLFACHNQVAKNFRIKNHVLRLDDSFMSKTKAIIWRLHAYVARCD